MEFTRGLRNAIGLLTLMVVLGVVLWFASGAEAQPTVRDKAANAEQSVMEWGFLKTILARDTTVAGSKVDSIDVMFTNPLRGYLTLLLGAEKAIGVDTVSVTYRPLYRGVKWTFVTDSAGVQRTVTDTLKPFNVNHAPYLMARQPLGNNVAPDSGGYGVAWTNLVLDGTNTLSDSSMRTARSTNLSIERNIFRTNVIPTNYCDGIRLYFTVQDSTRFRGMFKLQ